MPNLPFSTHLLLSSFGRNMLLLSLVLLSISLPAQREVNNWYFGNGAGIDFNGINPVAVTDGQLYNYEGCASISDFNGDLLFYTNGLTVWNKQHQVMFNGTGLLGDPSSSQSGVVIRLPGSQTRFYIFSVDDDGGTDGLRYSLVDISANNGLGAIIQKNVLLISPVTEKITAVLHNNGVNIWVIVHGWNNDAYHAFLVDPNGINAPVTTNIGMVHGFPVGNSRGCMKVSPDGSMVCAAIAFSNTAELFDFNDATGQLSNYRPLAPIEGVYGVEFSPDNSKLYLATVDIDPGKLYQYDLSNPSLAAIQASQTFLARTASQSIGALQIGPDRRIYVARFNSDSLGVISDPNALGAACNYNDNGFYLAGRQSQLGLPTFVQSFFLPPKPAFNFTVPCLGDSTRFFGNASEPPDTWAWDFGDPSSGAANFSGLQRPTHLYTAAGTYTVSLIVEKFGLRDTVTHTVTVYDYPQIDLGNDTIICDAPSLLLDPGGSGQFMLWNTGSSDPTITVSSSDIYWLEAGNGPCRIRDSIDVKFLQLDYVYIGADDVLCEGDSARLNAGNPGANYLWSTGATDQIIDVKSTGTYMVTVTAGICQLSDTATIRFVPQPSVDLGGDRSVCANELQLWGGTAEEFLWSTGENSPYIFVDRSGEYSIEVRNQFCTRFDTVDITLLTPAEVDLGPDRPFCAAEGEPISLTAIQNNVNYSWSTGENSQSILVNSPGLYSVELMTAEGCMDSDEILIYEECNTRVFVPTAFSPNGDGSNDEFFVVASSVSDFRMEIYDRWGALVFVATNPGDFWDGSISGQPAPEGVYICKIHYDGQLEGGTPISENLSSSVTLIR